MAKREKERDVERRLEYESFRGRESPVCALCMCVCVCVCVCLRVCAACDCLSNSVYIYRSCVAQDFFRNHPFSSLGVNPLSNLSAVATLTHRFLPKRDYFR